MNPKNPDLTALWLTAPQEAAKRVISYLRDFEGDVTRAAEGLGISRRTLYRWLRTKYELRGARERMSLVGLLRKEGIS